MMDIPITIGTYTDSAGNYRTSYPHNLMVVPVSQGISKSYLKPAEGIVQDAIGSGTGVVRGGINWLETLYRVVGDKLVSVSNDGTVTELGTVGDDSRPVSMDYSFDRLSITSNQDLFYWNSVSGLVQVTDIDLGDVKDHIWVDGYFMAIDDENIVVTELADPTQVDPTKYGSSEADPDPTVAILKLRNEPYVLNRHTIEAYQNVGGSGFPFAVIEGAQVQKGAVGTYMCCVYMEQIAFVGSGRKEAISVYLATGGNYQKIATREIELMLSNYNEATLSNLVMESRTFEAHELLYIHLTDITLVYDAVASRDMGYHVWFTLGSGIDQYSRYKARYFVWCYNRWCVGDPSTERMGYVTSDLGEHWGDEVGWQFQTDILYNDSNGAILHELELVGITGRMEIDDTAVIGTQYSYDGRAWSMLKTISAGRQGQRSKRLVWLQQGNMKDRRIQRFIGTSRDRTTFAKLKARVEPLAV